MKTSAGREGIITPKGKRANGTIQDQQPCGPKQHIHFRDDLIEEEQQHEDHGSHQDVAQQVGEGACRGRKCQGEGFFIHHSRARTGRGSPAALTQAVAEAG